MSCANRQALAHTLSYNTGICAIVFVPATVSILDKILSEENKFFIRNFHTILICSKIEIYIFVKENTRKKIYQESDCVY